MLLAGGSAAAHPQPTFLVTGNTMFTSSEIRAGTNRDQSDLLEPSGAISQEAVERLTLLIAAFYWDHGYANVKVQEPRIDRDHHRIEYALEEGPRFTISSVRVTGTLLEKEPRIMAMLTIKPGDVFSRTKIANDRTRLGTYYEDRAYAFANVLPLTKVDLANRTIGLTFEIDPGAAAFIEAIDIHNTTSVSTDAIRKVLLFAPKQPWHATRVEESRRRLKQSFPKVTLSTRRGTALNSVRVIIEID
jgi:outer membrane protein insertion porin family